MRVSIEAASRPFPRAGRKRRKPFPFVQLAILGACVLLTFAIALRETPPVEQAAPTTAHHGRKLVVSAYRPLLDPSFSLGAAPATFSASAPLAAELRRSVEPAPLAVATQETDAEPVVPVTIALVQPPQRPSELLVAPSAEALAEPRQDPPMPVARPSGLVLPGVTSDRPVPLVTARQQPRRNRGVSAPATAAVDNRNFFEKLFGVAKPEERGPAMAYAAPQDDVVDGLRGTRLSPMPAPTTMAAGKTAVYDIRAQTVYMPNGERLEAHSGLAEKMDDTRFVHVRMQGPTPPHVYDLTEREALFHGVRAIRLNPVGGSGAIHGRTGLLAHTYLLGPRGDSNGCVSFKDYERFLQAFLRGEVKRLVVVAGRA